ncbi:hypothetical protein GCM10020219_072600 [Nonomuraea dietziae]
MGTAATKVLSIQIPKGRVTATWATMMPSSWSPRPTRLIITESGMSMASAGSICTTSRVMRKLPRPLNLNLAMAVADSSANSEPISTVPSATIALLRR